MKIKEICGVLYFTLSSGIDVIHETGDNCKIKFSKDHECITEEITNRKPDWAGFVSDFTDKEYINWLKVANTLESDIMVIEWPDGTWVLKEDYRACDYTHMSDDYCIVPYNPEKHI